jgi:hypothetical protein
MVIFSQGDWNGALSQRFLRVAASTCEDAAEPNRRKREADKMIPDLVNGVLPEGIHRCSIEEIDRLFGGFSGSDRRIQLTQKFQTYVKDVRAVGIAVAVIVDGSYVTKKPQPNDIDLILVLPDDFDLSAELLPMEYNTQSRRIVKKLYGLDVLPARESRDDYWEYIDFFSRVNLNDPEQAAFPLRKGLLRMEL